MTKHKPRLASGLSTLAEIDEAKPTPRCQVPKKVGLQSQGVNYLSKQGWLEELGYGNLKCSQTGSRPSAAQ